MRFGFLNVIFYVMTTDLFRPHCGHLQNGKNKNKKVKVKQSHYRPEQAQRLGRGIALLFRDLGARRGWVVSLTPRPLYPRERPGTHCTGGSRTRIQVQIYMYSKYFCIYIRVYIHL
jgi:hypothetical protein